MDLPNKYRPKTFKQLVGQSSAVSTIKRALSMGRQQFVLAGETGCGKTTTARIIAAQRKTDPDTGLHELDAATRTGVAEWREEVRKLRIMPLGGGTKVCIVDEAHRLSSNAWDSLLKVIEEPPAHLTWVFCTTRLDKVPKTIRDRCTVAEFKPVRPHVLEELCETVAEAEGLELKDGVAKAVAQYAEGSPRATLSALEKVHGKSLKAAALVLQSAELDDEELVALGRVLSKRARWRTVVDTVRELQKAGHTGEAVRRVTYAYLSAVLMNTDERTAAELCEVLRRLGTPLASDAKPAELLPALGVLLLPEYCG